MKAICLRLAFMFLAVAGLVSCAKKEERLIKIAVEFVDHASSAYIAGEKGWFEKEGLKIEAIDNYITGMALASALTKGDIDAAYICMIPAISAYANAGVKLKVVCGTHKYGYSLLVNPRKVKSVEDLMKPEIRVACAREGSPLDVLLNKMIEKYNLDGKELKEKVIRMPPPRVLFALQIGQIDAGFCCEQFPTMGERMGFKEILKAQDLWPAMQGSVLVVKEELLRENPEIVTKLVRCTEKGIEYINNFPDEAAKIVAAALTVAEKKVLPLEVGEIAAKLKIRPEDIKRSLAKMENTSSIDTANIQEEIEYMAKLGYIKKEFPVEDIVDMRFIR